MRLWKCLPALLLFVFCGSNAFADFVPLRADLEGQTPRLQLIKNTDTEIIMEVQLPGVEVSSTMLQGRRWDSVEIPGGGFSNDLGVPDVPNFNRMLAIPARAGLRAELEVLESTTIDNIDLIPSQAKDPAEIEADAQPVEFDFSAYSRNSFFPEQQAQVGEPALMRGLRVATVQTNPVTYNPTTRQLRIAHRYRVKVHFEGTDLRNVPQRPMRPVSHAWAKLMRSVVANWDDLDVTEVPMGSYLIVCLNNSTLINSYVTPLAEWKRRLGHTVVVETFNQGANTYTVKNIIQDAYDSWDIPPEYVLLFGDVSGSYTLPGWIVYSSGQDDRIDHPYTQLDGTDPLADVAIGRLPADNTTESLAMVNKIIWYEKAPYIDNTNWFHQGVVIAGGDSWNNSGLSSIQVNRWIKTRMIEHGYTQVDTFWYTMPGSVNTTLTPAINNGVSVANYRGRNGMEDFTTFSIDQLSNSRKLPFVVTITCHTGGFYGMEESLMEHFFSVGTSSTPKGAIGCIGTATLETHTRQNNALNYGTFAGLYDEEITQAGNAMNRGKIELYNTYQTHDPSSVIDFSNYAALAGDPGVDIYTGAVHFMSGTVPENISYGLPLSLTVTEDGVGPLADATVCLYQSGSLQVVGTTDANGLISLPLGTVSSGNVKVTITKHNFYPIIDSLNVTQAGVVVNYLSNTIDDDNSGTSIGDGDGFINPGETIELPLVFKNFGTTTTATGVSVTATTTDNLATLTDNVETFPNIAPGATANSIDDFDVVVSPNTPNGHVIRLNLVTTAGQGTWDGIMDLLVKSSDMTTLSAKASGSDSLLSPGETANFVLTVRNDGDKTATDLTATITALDTTVHVNDNAASFGTVNIGATATCTGNPFNLTASSGIINGIPARLVVQFASSGGAVQRDTLTIYLGARSSIDPQGPDSYGYYCFDNTDVGYPWAPVYSWVEIDPTYGGSGTQLNIVDLGANQDASTNVTLPFTFRYYGEPTNAITVCSNGWISTHADVSYTDFRNYPIPSVPGPYGIIAPFWDDLTTVTGHVFSKYDAANHRYIVEWSRVQTLGTPYPQETFEVILLDPAFYPTPTGDGKIIFQYNTITEVAGDLTDNPYSTVGIESPDHSDGIEVTFWYTLHDAAATAPQSGRAYLFTTDVRPAGSAPTLDVTVNPVNPPVVIPANGGSFPYSVNIHVLAATPTTFSLWNKVRDSANQYTTVFGPISRTLPGGTNPSRILTQNIAGSISSGTLYFISYVGTYPNTVVDSSFFTITKSTVCDGNPWIGESFVTGDVFDEYSTIAAEPIPDRYALNQNYPNPFNPTTAISYELRTSSLVKLSVYDISGKKVAELVNGMREAGSHEITFDGSKLASGIYICRIQAGDFTASQKMVLMK
ncbi:MAG: C25 family cysteine peptidase [bacterium]|nr:C25 family cysteine peptidase [bacterium]